MTDAFALLEEPRQPWLEEAALKENFLNRSAATHPDKFSDPAQKADATDRFSALNTAHDTLREGLLTSITTLIPVTALRIPTSTHPGHVLAPPLLCLDLQHLHTDSWADS